MNLPTGDYNILRAKFLAAKSAFFHTLNHVSISRPAKQALLALEGYIPARRKYSGRN
jgi:hypothetical protein